MPESVGANLPELTLRQWVGALDSAEAVPAGGSLAAASAAAAAALAAKIARITVRKRKEIRADLPEHLRELANRLLRCADEDAAVYRSWRKHRDDRSAAEMIRVPLEIESLCRSAIEACLIMEAGLVAAVVEDLRAAVGILQACAQAAGAIAAANRRSLQPAT